MRRVAQCHPTSANHDAFRCLLTFLPLLLCTVSSATAAPADDPNAPPAENANPTTSPAAEHVWPLTPYLTGTAPQIRDRLNGETERLMLLVRQTNQDITDTTASIDVAQKSDIERVHKTAAYTKLAADLKVAEAAHQVATGSERLELSAAANKVRAAMTKLELDATRGDASLTDDRSHLRDLKASLTKHQEALKKARAWREQLLDAIRNTFQLQAPLERETQGTLGVVIPREIQPGGRVLIDFEAAELMGKGKNQEGVIEYNAIVHKVKLLIGGLDTRELKVGQSVTLDRNFIIEGISRNGGGEPLYLVRPRPADYDRLFELIVPLRDGTEPK